MRNLIFTTTGHSVRDKDILYNNSVLSVAQRYHQHHHFVYIFVATRTSTQSMNILICYKMPPTINSFLHLCQIQCIVWKVLFKLHFTNMLMIGFLTCMLCVIFDLRLLNFANRKSVYKYCSTTAVLRTGWFWPVIHLKSAMQRPHTWY